MTVARATVVSAELGLGLPGPALAIAAQRVGR